MGRDARRRVGRRERDVINEVLATAHFWAQTLAEEVIAQRKREAAKRSKGVPDSMMRVCRITDDQIYAFQYHLTAILLEMCKDPAWDDTQPDLASYFRCFGTDYNADHRIAEAAERAGIEVIDLYLPIKTKTWTNPGVVIARLGEGAPIITIYKRSDVDEYEDADRDGGGET